MGRTVLNGVLAVLLAGTLGLNWYARQGRTQPNFMFLFNMGFSKAYDAFAPNPNFADGKTLREPAPGTIPVELTPMHFGAGADEALRAGEELTNPFDAADAAAVSRGAAVFNTFCIPCHGAGAAGDGEVAKKGYPPPPSLVSGDLLSRKDGQIFHAITYGKGNMPAYAAQVSREDRWKAILYINTLRAQGLADAAKQQEAAPAAKSDASLSAATATAAVAATGTAAPEVKPAEGQPAKTAGRQVKQK